MLKGDIIIIPTAAELEHPAKGGFNQCGLHVLEFARYPTAKKGAIGSPHPAWMRASRNKKPPCLRSRGAFLRMHVGCDAIE